MKVSYHQETDSASNSLAGMDKLNLGSPARGHGYRFCDPLQIFYSCWHWDEVKTKIGVYAVISCGIILKFVIKAVWGFVVDDVVLKLGISKRQGQQGCIMYKFAGMLLPLTRMVQDSVVYSTCVKRWAATWYLWLLFYLGLICLEQVNLHSAIFVTSL